LHGADSEVLDGIILDSTAIANQQVIAFRLKLQLIYRQKQKLAASACSQLQQEKRKERAQGGFTVA